MKREKAIELAHNLNTGYNELQLEAFVVNAQYTDNRKLRQCLMELETREANLAEFLLNDKEKEAEIALKQEQIDSSDGHQKTIYEVEQQRLINAKRANGQHIDNVNKEINTIVGYIDDLMSKYQLETIEQVNEFVNDPELERRYWITRMGVQAATDMLTQGRIQAGNLQSLITMDNKDRTEAIAGAISFTKNMEGGLYALQAIVDEKAEVTGRLPDVSGDGLIDFGKLIGTVKNDNQ